MIRVRIVATVREGDRRRESLQSLVNVVTGLNVQFLRNNPRFPKIYASGVRYRREPANTREEFCTAPVVLAQGWGDCDDLGPWRAAELIAQGVPARAVVLRAGRGWHVVVMSAMGSEDPSARLGMGRHGTPEVV